MVEAVCYDIFEIFDSWSCSYVELQCPLAAAVEGEPYNIL